MRIAVIAALTCCAVAAGGVLQLRDGERVEGDLRRSTTGWEVTQADGTVRIIPESEVVSIQASGSAADASGSANARLASLRRAVENLSDINQILERYQQAMKQLSGTPAEAEAQADIEKWKSYQQKGMVKVGGRWLTPDEIAEIEETNLQRVEQAKGLLKQSRLKDAAALVDAVLKDDPENVAGLYLKGLIAYRQDQIPAARRAFEQAAEVLPSHGATLNNLAVVQWRQGATGIAMANFQRAMTAMPLNTVIHDNVAEVLHSLGTDARETQQLRRLQAQFQQDEPRLQANLRESGWYRWGGTWVTQDQLQELRAQEERIKSELDRLAVDFDRTKREVERIDDLIRRNNDLMSQLSAGAWVRDAQGRLVRVPVPNRYRELDDENADLKRRRDRELARLETLRKQAQEIRSQLAVPPYTGQLRLLDEQLTPVKLRDVGGAKEKAAG